MSNDIRVPQGTPSGGRFADHDRAEAEVDLENTASGKNPLGDIIQVNSKWQISPCFGRGPENRADGVVFVGSDLAGEGWTHKIDFYRFPIGWRSGALDRSELPAAVKTAIRKSMSNWP